jgi:uncharacterized protein YggE
MMNTRHLAHLGLLTCLTLNVLGRDAHAQRVEERYSTISVVGEGIASAPPDQATVRFGVVTRDDDPEVARSENAEAARRAMDAVRELIANDDAMRLENLSLQPAREFDPESRRYIELGFEAERYVVVEVSDLDVLPTLIARIVEEGANRLHQVSYELENQDAVRNTALERAMENATEKAETMAAVAGVGLGRVLRIAEQGTSMPIPLMRDMAVAEFAMAKAADPVPEAYAPGLIEVRTTVEVMFALRGEEE